MKKKCVGVLLKVKIFGSEQATKIIIINIKRYIFEEKRN